MPRKMLDIASRTPVPTFHPSPLIAVMSEETLVEMLVERNP
ncbi:MAG: hypothetical protein RIR52_2451 [Acidobacteriota bacterium]